MQTKTIAEAQQYQAIAVFAPGNYVYDFIPGVKVEVFHGYPVGKRGERGDKLDDHFTIREWFDIYCTQGESSTPIYQGLAKKHGFFKVYETGWCKVDPFFKPITNPDFAENNNNSKTILYSPTFSNGISSVALLFSTIETLAKKRDWKWIITFHPKITDPEILRKYQLLAEDNDNVSFEHNEGLATFQRADLMLCDSSSIILEFMLQDKPVVTFRNTNPGPHLVDVQQQSDVENAIDRALTCPPELMQHIKEYTHFHESHRDGGNAGRVLDAVDDFIQHHQTKMQKKPLNLLRKIKLRLSSGYYRW